MLLISAVWTLFAAALLAGVTAWFQFKSWKRQDQERLREKEQDAAMKVVAEVSSLMGKRLYRQKRYLWAVRSGDGTSIDKESLSYREVLIEWNERLHAMQAQIEYSFGRQFMMELETEIQAVFHRCHSEIEAFKCQGLGDLSSQERSLNCLGYEIKKYNGVMLKKIRDYDLTAFSKKGVVSFNNRHNLSLIYLFLRLFGLFEKSQRKF